MGFLKKITAADDLEVGLKLIGNLQHIAKELTTKNKDESISFLIKRLTSISDDLFDWVKKE
jgi:hypothetical protein